MDSSLFFFCALLAVVLLAGADRLLNVLKVGSKLRQALQGRQPLGRGPQAAPSGRSRPEQESMDPQVSSSRGAAARAGARGARPAAGCRPCGATRRTPVR